MCDPSVWSSKNQSQDVNLSSVAVETLPSLKRVDGRDTLGMSLARQSTPRHPGLVALHQECLCLSNSRVMAFQAQVEFKKLERGNGDGFAGYA